MVNFYVMQVRLNNITLDDVPERFREVVAERLNIKFINVYDSSMARD